MRKTLTLLALAALPMLAQAESAAETRWRSDISNGFARMERAWAAYQLKATSAQYEVGDEVTPAAAPAQPADLFNPYRLQPTARDNRSFALSNVTETTGTLCVDAIIKSTDDLNGFLLGMRQAKAQIAASECQPGALNSSIGFPTHIYARKVVTAERASQIIATDKAERAAQLAVADAIQFALPTGRLLDYTTVVNQSSEDKATVLFNSSGEVWAATAVVTDGPFVATLLGCEAVAPTGSCTLGVTFHPTTAGKVRGHVKVTTSTGKDLILRLAGTGSTAP